MNLSDATKLVAILKAAYPGAPVAPETPTAYLFGLEDIPVEAAMAAAKLAIQRLKFLPTPSELRGLLLEELLHLPSAEEAWGEVTQQIRNVGIYGRPDFSSSPVRQAVDAIGWRNICLSEEVRVERAHFLRIYEAYRDRAVREADLAALTSGDGDRAESISASVNTSRVEGVVRWDSN